MKFVYIGDEDRVTGDGRVIPMDPPKQTTVLGVTFELNGDAQEVPDNLVKRFDGMHIFKREEVKEEPKPAPKKVGRTKKES